MLRPISLLAGFLMIAACAGESEPNADGTPTAPAADPDTITASETLDAIPDALLGRWDFTEEGCADESSEMRLTIDTGRITYYESSATPISIRQSAPNNIVIEHLFSGEGEEWRETLAYELDEEGERLTVSTPDGNWSIRMRCSS